MGLFKVKKSKAWYFAVQKNGKRVVQSTGTSDKKLAKEIFAKVQYEIVRGTWFKNEKARTTTFEELVEKYMATYKRQRDESTKKHLLRHFGDKNLADIEPLDVEDYIASRLASPLKPSDVTVYLEYALGRRIFNVARKVYKWVTENPFADYDYKDLLDRDNPRQRVISVEEEIQLLTHAYDCKTRDFIIACIHSGCRTGEVLSWDWHESVDLFNRVLKVKVSKRTRKKVMFKHIPLSETLYQMLLGRSKVMHISGKVFPADRHEMRYGFDETRKKANITDVHIHDMRRTFSTRLDESGVPLHTIKTLMGHSTNDVTENHYIHRTVESLRQYVLLLDRYYEEHNVSIDDFIRIAV